MENPDKINCKACWNCGGLTGCCHPYPERKENGDPVCWTPNRNAMIVHSLPDATYESSATINTTGR